jgi:hypothetical protein
MTFLVSPGGMAVELLWGAILHRDPGFSPAVLSVLSGLVSALMVIVVTWLAAGARWTRWFWLPLAASLSTVSALLLDALMRA